MHAERRQVQAVELRRGERVIVKGLRKVGKPAKAPADSGRKYRLYPTQLQAERLIQWGHTCRTVWNLALEQRIYVYKQRRENLRADEQCRYLTPGASRSGLDRGPSFPGAPAGPEAPRQGLRQLLEPRPSRRVSPVQETQLALGDPIARTGRAGDQAEP